MQREWDSDRIVLSESYTPYLELEQKDSLEHVNRIIDQLPGLQGPPALLGFFANRLSQAQGRGR